MQADDFPSLEALTKRYLRLQSRARIHWAEVKKDAAKTGVDVRYFKKGLGKELDRLNAAGLAAKEAKNVLGKNSEVTKSAVKAVTKQQKKVMDIITAYKKACRTNEQWKDTPPGQAQGWHALYDGLDSVYSAVGDFTREILR